ncbi:MAG: ABC transporter substrate-binding protein [Bdellovibrionales bacterium]|nr:ABC transporter substrate-binding protein [Bdellovibrionales bacterium]
MQPSLPPICVHLVFLLSACFVSATAADADEKHANSSSPIRIGAILPLSGDGAFWGVNPKRGVELALQDLKAQPGTPPIDVIYEDDRCDPAAATSAFKKLTNVDNVKIILGPSCSSASLAVAPLAAQAGVLLFPFSEADSISGLGAGVFRLWSPNGRQARRLARHIKNTEQVTSIAVLAIQNAYGEDFIRAFKEEFERLNGQIVAEEEYLPDQFDARASLIRIKPKKPEALLLASYIADGAAICRQARDLRVAPKLFGSSTLNSPDFFSQTEGCAEGMKMFDLPDPTPTAFRSRWEAEFGEPWPGLQSGAPIFYDMMFFLVEAAARAGTEPAALGAHLSNGARHVGKSLSLEFDSKHDLIAEHTLFEVKGNTLVAGSK